MATGEEQKELNRRVFAVVSALNEAGDKTYTTTVQKIVYLSLAFEGKDEEWFRPHLHGPFSEAVACGLDLMVGAYLEVELEPDGRLYYPARDAREFVGPGIWSQINALKGEASQLIKKIKEALKPQSLTPASITKLAEVHWLKKNYPEADPEFLRARALMMAWDLTMEDVKQNLQYLEKLELLGKETSMQRRP